MNEELEVIKAEIVEDEKIEQIVTISENNIQKNEEKVLEKVEIKNNTKKNRQTKLTKECPVLSYNKAKHFVIINFDGYGIRINEIMKNPGKILEVKYSGEIGTPTFKLEMK